MCILATEVSRANRRDRSHGDRSHVSRSYYHLLVLVSLFGARKYKLDMWFAGSKGAVLTLGGSAVVHLKATHYCAGGPLFQKLIVVAFARVLSCGRSINLVVHSGSLMHCCRMLWFVDLRLAQVTCLWILLFDCRTGMRRVWAELLVVADRHE